MKPSEIDLRDPHLLGQIIDYAAVFCFMILIGTNLKSKSTEIIEIGVFDIILVVTILGSIVARIICFRLSLKKEIEDRKREARILKKIKKEEEIKKLRRNPRLALTRDFEEPEMPPWFAAIYILLVVSMIIFGIIKFNH